MAVAALWGFAEATLFFIVRDVLLTGIAVRRGCRTALRATAWAIVGAVSRRRPDVSLVHAGSGECGGTARPPAGDRAGNDRRGSTPTSGAPAFRPRRSAPFPASRTRSMP